ncbi:MAG: ABC transporter substrate-binding protein [Candidatus Babeliales bacterium]
MNSITKLSIATILTLIAGAVVLTRYQQPAATNMLTIGILQTASHPALDATRQGFTDTLEKELHGNIQFIIRNAEGSVPAAHTLARSLKAHNIDGIYAIATQAAQAIANMEQEKPIFIAAVTDPQAAGICNQNVCGCTDKISIEATINLLQELVPHAQRVAIIANSGEVNSQVQVNHMQELLKSHGLTPIVFGLTSEADVAPATTSASLKADVLLVPNDNIIGSSIQLVAAIALKHNKAVIACANTFVEQGALAARGVDYYKTGAQAAHQALKVLVNGVSPREISLADPDEGIVTINTKIADALRIIIPDVLLKNSVFVKG